MDQRENQRHLDLVAFFGALCLFFSTIEYLFPKPFPFFRLGLANLPVLLSLELFSPGYVLLVVVLKVVGQGLVNGTLASYVFLFSAAGSFTSAAIMLLVHRLGRQRISLIGVSLFGSLSSNAVQLALSVTFIFGSSAWVIAPPLVGIGVATGAIVGLFAERFSHGSMWIRLVRERINGT